MNSTGDKKINSSVTRKTLRVWNTVVNVLRAISRTMVVNKWYTTAAMLVLYDIYWWPVTVYAVTLSRRIVAHDNDIVMAIIGNETNTTRPSSVVRFLRVFPISYQQGYSKFRGNRCVIFIFDFRFFYRIFFGPTNIFNFDPSANYWRFRTL